MLSIGWPELMVVAAAALIIVGPRDLPTLLRNIGQVMGRVRRMSNEFRSEINKVAALDDVKDIRKSITAPLAETRTSIESEFNKIGKDGVSPSGKLEPTDPEVESVYDRIKQQTGDIDLPESAKFAQSKPITKTAKSAKTRKAPARSSKPKTAAKPATKQAAKPTAKSKAAAKPVAKQSTKPKAVSKSATKPVSKPATKPKAAKPAASKTTAAKSTATKTAATKAAAPKTGATRRTATKPRATRKQPASKA